MLMLVDSCPRGIIRRVGGRRGWIRGESARHKGIVGIAAADGCVFVLEGWSACVMLEEAVEL